MSNKPNAPFVAAQRIDPTHVLITRMIDDSPRPWTVFPDPPCGSLHVFVEFCCGLNADQGLPTAADVRLRPIGSAEVGGNGCL